MSRCKASSEQQEVEHLKVFKNGKTLEWTPFQQVKWASRKERRQENLWNLKMKSTSKPNLICSPKYLLVLVLACQERWRQKESAMIWLLHSPVTATFFLLFLLSLPFEWIPLALGGTTMRPLKEPPKKKVVQQTEKIKNSTIPKTEE